jgi:hypothetical protein
LRRIELNEEWNHEPFSMSSSSENDSGAEEDTINGDVTNGEQHAAVEEEGEDGQSGDGRIVELLQEEREGASTPQKLGNGTNRYKAAQPAESASEDGSMDTLPRRTGSPIDSVMSIPDDSPSVQVCYSIITSGLSDIVYRAPSYHLLVEVVFYLLWPQDQASEVQHRPSGPSIDASNPDFPAQIFKCPALPLPPPRISKLADARTLSVVSCYSMLGIPRPHHHLGK